MPDHDNIFEVKLAKIKNEALTKENLEQGTDYLKEVLEKLEKILWSYF